MGPKCFLSYFVIEDRLIFHHFISRGKYPKKSNNSYWLDDLYCYGHEANLGHCWSRGLGSHNCDANEEAGVICSNKTDPGSLKPIPSEASGKVAHSIKEYIPLFEI